MGTNLRQALEDLKKLEEEIIKEIKDIEVELVTTIFDRLKGLPPTGTPRDTHWASAGWRISLNRPTPGQVKDKGNVNAARTYQKKSMDRFINTDCLKMKKIFIDNRVPYIDDLNDGTASKQSYTDFIDLAVQAGYMKVKRRNIVG